MEKAIKKQKQVKKNTEDKGNPQLVCMVKALAIAFAITCIVFITYALILTYTSITEQNIPLVSLICTVVSAAVAGFDSAKGAKSRGLIWGMAAGVIYAVLLFAICILSGAEFVLNGGKMTLLLISLAGGGIGGIMGINIHKK